MVDTWLVTRRWLNAVMHSDRVVWAPDLGAWIVTGRELAIDVIRDAERFTVEDPRFSTAQVVGPSMLSTDGDEHRRHRTPFVSTFRPTDLGLRLGAMIERRVDYLIDRILERGEGDLATDLAGPLATYSAAAALGIEHVDCDALLSWYRRIVAETERISLGGVRSDDAEDALAWVVGVLDDALTDPAHVLHHVADRLDRAEVVSNVAVYLFGAIETTEGMIANLFARLLDLPDVLDAVRSDRGLVEAAIEESLRLEPSVTRVDRYATREVTLDRCDIAAGDFVIVSLSAANRDPEVYRSPHEFRLDRSDEPGHITFAQGPHACIGAHIARFEARTALTAVLDRLPDVSLRPGAQVSIDGVVFRKARSLPIRWRSST